MELLDKKEFAVSAYKPFYDQLQELEKNNSSIAFDYESAKGNKEAREQAKREADTKHKSSVNRAALAAMVENGINEECAKKCIKLIEQGKVPAISIFY
jgi:hypothetical protein